MIFMGIKFRMARMQKLQFWGLIECIFGQSGGFVMTIKEVEQYLEHFDISDTEENLGDSVPKAI